MSKKQFDQQQKLTNACFAQEIRFEEVAKIRGIHYMTVYDCQHQLEDLCEI